MCWTSFETIGHSSKNLGPSENSSPFLVPQAGYGPASLEDNFTFNKYLFQCACNFTTI